MTDVMFTLIRLSWKPPLNPNGDILSYEIVYIPIVGPPVEVNVRLNFSYTIAHLIPKTVLPEVTVFALNSAGRGEPSTIENLKTVEPPREKTNSEAYNICRLNYLFMGSRGMGGGGGGGGVALEVICCTSIHEKKP